MSALPLEAEPALPASQRKGLLALAAAAFACVTTETLPIGLLPQMSRAFGVSTSTTGHLVSLYAGTVMLLAVPMTILTRRIPGKNLLLGTMAGFSVCNVASALAPGFGMLAASRGVAGLLHAVFFSVCIGYASRLVTAERTGRAMALLSAGISAGLILGSPLATMIGGLLGWRPAFGALVVLTALATVLMAIWLPGRTVSGVAEAGVRPPGRRRDAAVVYTATMLTYIGQFTLYTYVSVVLLRSGAPAGAIGPLLALFGFVGLLGIWRAAPMLDHDPRRAGLLLLGGSALGVIAVGFAVPHLLPVVLAGMLWNGVFGPVASLYQSASVRAGGVTPELAGAWINTTANIGITVGAVLGGATLDHLPLRYLAWVAAIPMLLGVLTVALGRGGFPGRAQEGAPGGEPKGDILSG